MPRLDKQDSLSALKLAAARHTNIDSMVARLSPDKHRQVVKNAMEYARMEANELSYKGEYAYSLSKRVRTHEIEAINKITLALSCIIFFFIGAPLGAIIRKGGLGVPVIISVLVFIVYYIFENSGMKMARDDNWTVWFGKWISTMVLAPLAVFFTYKANKDSVVFNIDLYKQLIRSMLGLRMKRSITRKEVIIEEPKYLTDADLLKGVSVEVDHYSKEHKLLFWPNPIKVFFRPGDDHEIEHLNNAMETAIEDLSFTTDKYVLMKINQYPIIATHAHTRPFQRRWLNIVTGLFLPTGLFFYFRMIRFRIRLYKDLQHIIRINKKLIPKLIELANFQKETSLYN